MNPADILDGLLRLNLVAAAAVVAVLALRPFARRLFGPSVAYALWLAVPAAVLAIALPARRLLLPSLIPAQAATPNVAAPVVMAAGPLPGDPRPWLIALWIGGALAFAAVLIWRQRQLLVSAGRLVLTSDRSIRRADAKGIGPAVVGAFNPHVIVPSDFEDRFDAEERVLVLAHEWAHLRRQDARINGLVALIQCGLWFNPLVHIAARAIRMDQELACDAAVITQFPDARRRYAEAMLKTQVTTTPLPFGCYWPANSVGPLKERIAMLKLKAPTRVQRLLGGGVIAALALGAAAAAWAAKPAEVVFETEAAAIGPVAQPAPSAYAETPAPAPQARPTRGARPAAASRATPSPQAAFTLAEAAPPEPPLPPPPPPAPPAPTPPRAARPPAPPAPPPVPPVPAVPRTPRVAVAKGGMIRCKLDAAGHPASCSMPAFGEPKAGEVDVPFTPPDMSAFREQFDKGQFKGFDKGQWKDFDRQVFIERGHALSEAEREAARARGEAMRARAIDARKLGELGRKQGELERRAAELTARNASASEISAARAAADANRAQLDAEAKRVGEEAAKLGADVRVRIAPRAEPDPRPTPAPKVRP